MTQCVSIADDLTGANVNASLLAACGFSAATCAFGLQWDAAFFSQYDVVSINTASRLMSADEACEAVRVATVQALALQPAVLSKRIDSTLRGNVGSEIEGALAALPAQTVAIVSPAYPASGRIVVGGYMIVDAVPLQCSQVALDPTNPLFSSHVPTLLGEQSTLSQYYIDMSVFLRGKDALLTALQAGIASGARCILCDGVTDSDIQHLASALCMLKAQGQPLLLVDPGPLTAAYTSQLLGTPPKTRENRVLLTIGSVMESIRRQLDMLRIAHASPDPRALCIVRADCAKLATEHSCAAEVARVVTHILACGDECQLFCVCTALHLSEVVDIAALAAAEGVSSAEISRRINIGLAQITVRLLQEQRLRIGGLFTSGGEVTLAVTGELQAMGFSVRDEVLPRAMYGHLIGGHYHGLPMITKGGFAGDDQAIVRCVDYLFTKISTKTSTE